MTLYSVKNPNVYTAYRFLLGGGVSQLEKSYWDDPLVVHASPHVHISGCNHNQSFGETGFNQNVTITIDATATSSEKAGSSISC